MGSLQDMANRLKNIDMLRIFDNILVEHLPLIEELNREQLNQGIRSDGSSMPSHKNTEKTEIYIDNKIERGVYDQSIYPAMNFYDTGDFHRGIKAEVNLFEIKIESKDSKADELEALGGSLIYGNTENNLSDVRAEILPKLLNETRSKLGI